MRRPPRPLVAFLLALLLVGLGGLAACGSDDGDDEADDSGTTETSEVFDPDAGTGGDDDTTTTEDDDGGSSGSGDCQPEPGEDNEASAIRQVIDCLDPDLAEPANSVSTSGDPVTSVYVEGDIAEPDAVALCELIAEAAYGPVGVDADAGIEIATRSTDGDDEPRVIATRDGEDGDCEAA